MGTLLASATAFAPISSGFKPSSALFETKSEKVTEIVVNQLACDAEKVVPEATFINDLGADSLDTVELIMAIEEEFDVEIPEDEAAKISTVGEVLEYMEKNGS